MTYRTSFSSAYGGRGSPYAARPTTIDRSFSDMFEYVDPSETGPRVYGEQVSEIPVEDDGAPDILHVKYMGQSFILQFPAYSISESGVTVQEVRRRIADKLQQDPRRVRLIYKDRELRSDRYAVKRYGCKQNSEIAVVVSDAYNDYGGADNQHSSGDDSGSGSSLKPPTNNSRPRGLSTVRHRNDEAKVEVRSPTTSATFLHPNGYSTRDSRNDGRRSVSPGRTAEPPSPRAPSISVSRPPSADPSTPMGKVQALQHEYYDKWLPESRQYLNAPPTDTATRDREHRRLTESIMKNIIEAADAIELQGDTEARAERKKVLGEAQETLRKLDAVVHSK